MRNRLRTAFVLSGGGSLGSIQVGMLRALYERGIVPDFVVGTSAGALNAAFVADRPQTVETVDALADVWRGLRRGRVFPLNAVTATLGLVGGRDHLVPDSGLRRLVEDHVRVDRVEHTGIPLHVIAVDAVTGEELRLSRGPMIDALLASAAIPAVLPAVPWGDRQLIDGGVANNTPLSHAVELGADVIYVLPTGHSCALAQPPRGALAMALNALTLMTHHRLVEDVAKYENEARLVVLPPPCPLAVAPTDFSHADELMCQAYTDACTFLDAGRFGPATRNVLRAA